MATSSKENTSQSEVGQVFEQFKSYIDTRLTDLTGSLLSANRDHTVDTSDIQVSARKLQREADASRFKYKANAKQFLHNVEVEEMVASTVEHLEKETPDQEQAVESAKKALALVQKQQKMIKLADRSEVGWFVVEEYESDELTEDSEDDKNIRRAQDKAARKKKQLLQMSNKR
jgi:hypothetical protein